MVHLQLTPRLLDAIHLAMANNAPEELLNELKEFKDINPEDLMYRLMKIAKGSDDSTVDINESELELQKAQSVPHRVVSQLSKFLGKEYPGNCYLF
jgi:hypothetical protein